MSREVWKRLDDTQQFLERIKQKKEEIKEDLTSGSLLLHSNEKIAHEYIFNVGMLEALKFVENEIKAGEDEDE